MSMSGWLEGEGLHGTIVSRWPLWPPVWQRLRMCFGKHRTVSRRSDNILGQSVIVNIFISVVMHWLERVTAKLDGAVTHVTGVVRFSRTEGTASPLVTAETMPTVPQSTVPVCAVLDSRAIIARNPATRVGLAKTAQSVANVRMAPAVPQKQGNASASLVGRASSAIVPVTRDSMDQTVLNGACVRTGPRVTL